MCNLLLLDVELELYRIRNKSIVLVSTWSDKEKRGDLADLNNYCALIFK